MKPILPLAALALTSLAHAQYTCTSQAYGTSCGPVMSMAFQPQGNGGNRVFDIACTGLQPGVIGVMGWGVQQLNVPLWDGCSLYMDYVWGHTFQTGPLGDFTWSRTWPAGAMPQTYFIQFASVDFRADGSVGLLTSNAVRAACL